MRIFTLSGELVRDLAVEAADKGCKSWDGRNSAGRDAASGVYLAVISSSSGARSVQKLALER